MHSKDKLSIRALQTGALLTLITTLLLFVMKRPLWAWSFLIGAGVSLFSLSSLTLSVPLLFRSGRQSVVCKLLRIVLFMKLPIYVIALYTMARMVGENRVAIVAAVVGSALSPTVIFLKTLGEMWVQSGEEIRESKRAGTGEFRTKGAAGKPKRTVSLREGV